MTGSHENHEGGIVEISLNPTPTRSRKMLLSSKSQFDQMYQTQNTHNPWVWLASSQALGLILKNTEYKSANEKQRKLSLKKNLVIDSI